MITLTLSIGRDPARTCDGCQKRYFAEIAARECSRRLPPAHQAETHCFAVVVSGPVAHSRCRCHGCFEFTKRWYPLTCASSALLSWYMCKGHVYFFCEVLGSLGCRWDLIVSLGVGFEWKVCDEFHMLFAARSPFDNEVLMFMEPCTDPSLSVLFYSLFMAQEFYGCGVGGNEVPKNWGTRQPQPLSPYPLVPTPDVTLNRPHNRNPYNPLSPSCSLDCSFCDE